MTSSQTLESLPKVPDGAELFEVSLPGQAAPDQHVLICSGEKGGMDALLPTMQQLLGRNVGVSALLSDAGLRTFRAVGDRYGLEAQTLPDWSEINRRPPEALIFTPSPDGAVEQSLSEFKAPWVVVEDYYVSSRNIVRLALDKQLPPPTVCVIDEQAERLLAERFPGTAIPTELTGSPAFDILHGEDVAAEQQRIKSELGITDKKLIAVMLPYLTDTRLAEGIADACQELGDDTVIALKSHPRDTNGSAVYEKIFQGVQMLDMEKSKGLGIGADLVITQRSTYSLTAVIRQQLNIALSDDVPEGFTLPTVDAGASLGASVASLQAAITELLDGKSERCATLRRNMQPYAADGRSALRVADVICRQLASR